MDEPEDMTSVQQALTPDSILDNALTMFDRLPDQLKDDFIQKYEVGVAEFSRCLIRLALIRRYRDQDVFISNRKSMTLCIFIHSRSKRAETVALLDSGATENFMNIRYA